MGILSWILLGLVAGAIAKALHPGKDPQGCLITIFIGIIGSVLGGWIATMLGWGSVNGFNLYSILIATGGAVLALVIYITLLQAEEGVMIFRTDNLSQIKKSLQTKTLFYSMNCLLIFPGRRIAAPLVPA